MFSTNAKSSATLYVLVDTADVPDPDTARRIVTMAALGLNLEDLQAIRPTLQLGVPQK